MKEETGRVALITGGSRGIGRAIVEELAARGWNTAFTYLSAEDKAKTLERSMKEAGQSCLSLQADVCDFERSEAVIQQVENELGPISLLVNNAGIKRDAALAQMDPLQWEDVIDTNLNGTFHYCRALLMRMIKRQTGAIINIVSVSGILGLPGQANYAASKAGVIALTKSLAREVARFQIRVNAVAPGFIETDMLEDLPAARKKKLFRQIAMGEPGSPEQVAKLVSFLAGEDAAYITGQIIPVDGGMV